MCRLPVMLGGGRDMEKGILSLAGLAVNTLAASQVAYQRSCADLKSKALSISRIVISQPKNIRRDRGGG